MGARDNALPFKGPVCVNVGPDILDRVLVEEVGSRNANKIGNLGPPVMGNLPEHVRKVMPLVAMQCQRPGQAEGGHGGT